MNTITFNQSTPFRFAVRKGTNAERLSIVLEEGELGYTTDTNRVFIGDGITLGGNLVSNKITNLSTYSLTSSYHCENGDLIYINDKNTIYIYNNTYIPLNIVGNFNYNEDLFSLNSKNQLTLKPLSNISAIGSISYLKVDSYGRIVDII